MNKPTQCLAKDVSRATAYQEVASAIVASTPVAQAGAGTVRSRRRLAPLIFAALVQASCTSHTSEPSVELNPHPMQHYTVDASIIDAPGPFDKVEAQAVYEVEDRSCVPLAPVSGSRLTPRHEIPLTVTRIGDAYRTSVAADAILDGDYYGHGMCHWTLSLVSITAVVQNRRFVSVIPPVGAYAKRNVTTYFSRQSFDHAARPLVDTGLYDKSGFDHPDNTFHFDLVARKTVP